MAARANQPIDEAELIANAQAGDPEAFSELHRRHIAVARSVAGRVARSRVDAEDLVAEAFARILAALRRNGGPSERFRPYLITTIRNLARDDYRRAEREPVAPAPFDDVPTDDGESALGGPSGLAVEALAQLPARWRLALWLAEVEDRPPAEIAEILGASRAAASSLASRAREGLRRSYLASEIDLPVTSRDCQWVRGLIADQVRGASGIRTDAVVDRHLERCELCRQVRDRITDLNAQLPVRGRSLRSAPVRSALHGQPPPLTDPRPIRGADPGGGEGN